MILLYNAIRSSRGTYLKHVYCIVHNRELRKFTGRVQCIYIYSELPGLTTILGLHVELQTIYT